MNSDVRSKIRVQLSDRLSKNVWFAGGYFPLRVYNSRRLQRLSCVLCVSPTVKLDRNSKIVKTLTMR